MPRVTVDGVEYKPTDNEAKPLVAVAITTRNRPAVLERCLTALRALTPNEFPIIIVDDASETPVCPIIPEGGNGWPVYRFTHNVGIPAAKNKAIELCMETGAEHIFLLDDDCWPAVADWWKPYVFGAEPHYSYIFTHWSDGRPVGDCEPHYDDGQQVAYTMTRGCAIYLRRNVIDTVGGMNTRFGKGMNEHLEYSQRICNAGLTTFPYMDVANSQHLWHSLDQHQDVERTLSAQDRQQLLARNNRILESLQGAKGFVEYRDLPNLVVTQLLTSGVDGQRGTKWDADAKHIDAWRKSILSGNPVVLTDEIESGEGGDGCQFVNMPIGWTVPHHQRWVSTLQYLREHPAQFVWLTDGSDVEMLQEPWAEMHPHFLYVGSEPVTVSKPWLLQHHPFYSQWIKDHGHYQMLNCGLIGGTWENVTAFVGDLVRELARAHGKVDYEMGSFNYVCRELWSDRISFGPHVNNVFKSNDKSTDHWWRHK